MVIGVVIAYYLPLTTYHSLLTTYYLPFTTHYYNYYYAFLQVRDSDVDFVGWPALQLWAATQQPRQFILAMRGEDTESFAPASAGTRPMSFGFYTPTSGSKTALGRLQGAGEDDEDATPQHVIYIIVVRAAMGASGFIANNSAGSSAAVGGDDDQLGAIITQWAQATVSTVTGGEDWPTRQFVDNRCGERRCGVAAEAVSRSGRGGVA